jgi:hypothetical protein
MTPLLDLEPIINGGVNNKKHKNEIEFETKMRQQRR